jgi:hypothetical protein
MTFIGPELPKHVTEATTRAKEDQWGRSGAAVHNNINTTNVSTCKFNGKGHGKRVLLESDRKSNFEKRARDAATATPILKVGGLMILCRRKYSLSPFQWSKCTNPILRLIYLVFAGLFYIPAFPVVTILKNIAKVVRSPPYVSTSRMLFRYRAALCSLSQWPQIYSQQPFQ